MKLFNGIRFRILIIALIFNSIGVARGEDVLIPADLFQMGDVLGDAGPDELPGHQDYVSAFYMAKTEVTSMNEVSQRSTGAELGDRRVREWGSEGVRE
jgi:hypothetical protein